MGGGYTFLRDVVEDAGITFSVNTTIPSSVVLEELGGTIGQKYAQAEANITFTEGAIADEPANRL